MNDRYYSLDIFRGATVAFMILVNNPGTWGHIYPALDHAEWNGCTPTDLVFPFFLFAVGNSLAFVMPRLKRESTNLFLKKIIKRTFLIFSIGLFLNWCPFVKWINNQLFFKPWSYMAKDDNGFIYEDGVRVLGVLQRIAICYFFASLIVFFTKPKATLYIAIIILLSYWFFCNFFGSLDPYSITGYFGRTIDIIVLSKSHMLHIDKINNTVFHFDYEGIASSFTTIVQIIFGYFTGKYIIEKGKTYEMLSHLFLAGIICIFIGYSWDSFFPINKKIWSSSFTVYTTGLALFTLASLIYILEFKDKVGLWAKFFEVFGKNPLFIFVLSGFLPRVLGLVRIPKGIDANGLPKFYSPFGWFYENFCKNISSDLRLGSFIFALSIIVFYWLIAYILDKKNIYIKV